MDLIESAFLILVCGTPILAILWAWLWVRFRNALFRRHHPHACFRCGYDLTGNVSGRCPECGTSLATIESTE